MGAMDPQVFCLLPQSVNVIFSVADLGFKLSDLASQFVVLASLGFKAPLDVAILSSQTLVYSPLVVELSLSR
jgi:hypothetical protein